VKSFVKCLAHDGTLKRCASSAKSARSCCLVLKLLKFSLYLMLNEKFQYSGLKALGCLPYPVMRPSMWSRDHLRKKNVQYGDLEVPRCLSYPVVRSSVQSRDHLRI
jgi:hypothetical protein